MNPPDPPDDLGERVDRPRPDRSTLAGCRRFGLSPRINGGYNRPHDNQPTTKGPDMHDGIRDRWESDDGRVVLLLGDALEILPGLDVAVDGVVTDPPYSSGGMFRGDRTQKTVAKYVQTSAVDTCRDEFTGDNRDQRAFAVWCGLWSLACHTLAVDGGVLVSFIDWRQLPTLTDAVQVGGWIWRAVCTWHKPGVRHIEGRFSASSEFCVYASRGIPTKGPKSPCNVFTCPPVRGEDKEHVAEKPVAVLAWALSVVRDDGLVLDPFMGSGTTGVAAIDNGRRFVGIEKDARIFRGAVKRVRDHLAQGRLFKPKATPAPPSPSLFGDLDEVVAAEPVAEADRPPLAEVDPFVDP